MRNRALLVFAAVLLAIYLPVAVFGTTGSGLRAGLAFYAVAVSMWIGFILGRGGDK